MKIVIIGEEIFCEKMRKLFDSINIDIESVILNIDLENASYETLLHYYEVISSLLESFALEDKVLCLIGLEISLLEFEKMPYIHLAYERKHEILSLYFYELLFSRLILSYPEVWWVFVSTILNNLNNNLNFYIRSFELYKGNKSIRDLILEKLFFYFNVSPLFDIDGFYEFLLKEKTGKPLESKKPKNIVFYIFEEELDYIFYIFYALSDFQEAKVYPLHLYTLAVKFLKSLNICKHKKKFFYFLHDRYYYPIDLPSEKELDNLRKRFEEFNLKKKSEKCRNVIHILVSFSEIREEEEFINNEIRKPLNSIYSFQEEVKKYLPKEYTLTKEISYGIKSEVHSSKGVLTEIATKILRRAEIYYENVKSPEEAFTVAIMARYALQILEKKNLNLLYKAFSLKIKAESLGEVIFTGSDINIDIEQKVKEIEDFLKDLKETFNLSVEKITSLELLLLNDILNIYKEHNQLEEELALTNFIREKIFKKKLRKKDFKITSFSFKEVISTAKANPKVLLNNLIYWLIHSFLIKPLFSFKRAIAMTLIFVVFSVVLYLVLHGGFQYEILVKALIDTLYGIMTANVGGNLFGIIISIFNIWLMVIVIGYFLTYIIRR